MMSSKRPRNTITTRVQRVQSTSLHGKPQQQTLTQCFAQTDQDNLQYTASRINTDGDRSNSSKNDPLDLPGTFARTEFKKANSRRISMGSSLSGGRAKKSGLTDRSSTIQSFSSIDETTAAASIPEDLDDDELIKACAEKEAEYLAKKGMQTKDCTEKPPMEMPKWVSYQDESGVDKRMEDCPEYKLRNSNETKITNLVNWYDGKDETRLPNKFIFGTMEHSIETKDYDTKALEHPDDEGYDLTLEEMRKIDIALTPIYEDQEDIVKVLSQDNKSQLSQPSQDDENQEQQEEYRAIDVDDGPVLANEFVDSCLRDKFEDGHQRLVLDNELVNKYLTMHGSNHVNDIQCNEDRLGGGKGAHISSPPKKRRKGKQSLITQFPTEDEIINQGNFMNSNKDKVFFDSPDLITKVFKAKETYCIRLPHPHEEKYYVTVKEFVVVKGKWAAVPDKICVDISKTRFLGKKECESLFASSKWSQIPESDRNKAVLLNGKYILRKDGSNLLDGKTPIRVGLLESDPVPTPRPHLVYDAKNEEFTESLNVAFYTPHRWVYKECDEQIRTMELFSGAGGFSLGLKEAGFDIKAAVDHNHKAMATYSSNMKSGETFDMTVDDFLDIFPRWNKSDKIRHLHASPPCQGVSRANRGGGKDDIINNEQMYKVVRATKLSQAETVSIENVTGLLAPDNVMYVKHLVCAFLFIGYNVRVCTLRASDYGDPQHRLRVFLLASRFDHKLPEAPIPTHGPGTCKKHLTVREVLSQFEDVEPSDKDAVVITPDGNLLYNHWMDKRNRPENEKERTELPADLPAPTLLRKNYLQHYSLPRALTLRERACLQSFPVGFKFHGTFSDINYMIGNAVPVRLATAVAKSVRESYNYTA